MHIFLILNNFYFTLNNSWIHKPGNTEQYTSVLNYQVKIKISGQILFNKYNINYNKQCIAKYTLYSQINPNIQYTFKKIYITYNPAF